MAEEQLNSATTRYITKLSTALHSVEKNIEEKAIKNVHFLAQAYLMKQPIVSRFHFFLLSIGLWFSNIFVALKVYFFS